MIQKEKNNSINTHHIVPKILIYLNALVDCCIITRPISTLTIQSQPSQGDAPQGKQYNHNTARIPST